MEKFANFEVPVEKEKVVESIKEKKNKGCPVGEKGEPGESGILKKTYLKKFNDFEIKSELNEDDVLENEFYETLEGIDESILADIRKMGFGKAFKRLGRGIMLGVSDILKKNPKVAKMFKDGINKYGKSFVEDASQIMGETVKNLEKKIEEKQKDWEKKEKEWLDKEREFEKNQ